MNYAHPELRERLAADYALGTLRGAARRRFERLLAGDGALRELVQDWELRVNLLAESAPAVSPPPRVWDGIARRIGPMPARTASREGRFERLWHSLGFWRGAGLLAAGAAAALAVFVVLRPPAVDPGQLAALDRRLGGIEDKLAAIESTPREIGALGDRLARIEGATQGVADTSDAIAALGERLTGIESRLSVTAPPPSHVAVLLDKDSRPMMTADLDVADGRLILRLNVRPPRDFTGKTLEVWLVPPDGAPHSLGLFPSERSGTTTVLVLPPDVAAALAAPESALAVSLEPKGGSTTGAPTGPVLFSGGIMPVDL